MDLLILITVPEVELVQRFQRRPLQVDAVAFPSFSVWQPLLVNPCMCIVLKLAADFGNYRRSCCSERCTIVYRQWLVDWCVYLL